MSAGNGGVMVKLVLVTARASNQPCVQSTSNTTGKRLQKKRGKIKRKRCIGV